MAHLLASRWVPALLAGAAVIATQAVARLLGWEGWPALGPESGLLLFWGIGHCDTLDGPVVQLGKRALAEKNVNLVLPWVRAEDEEQIRHVFDHAQAVRELGPQARSLADLHFLETLVRVHRAGEGAPYSGLKPAGLDLGPAVPAADRALQSGSPDALIVLLADAVSAGVRTRFQAARDLQAFDPDDVGAGRRYVHAYVPYVHYVEKIWEVTSGKVAASQCGGDHGPAAGAHAHGGHAH